MFIKMIRIDFLTFPFFFSFFFDEKYSQTFPTEVTGFTFLSPTEAGQRVTQFLSCSRSTFQSGTLISNVAGGVMLLSRR